MLFLQSILLNWLLEQSLVIHNRCTGDVISHPIHQSPDSIKLNLGWAPSCVIDRHIALTSHPFAVVQTWRGIWGVGGHYYWSGQKVGAKWSHNEIIQNFTLNYVFWPIFRDTLPSLCFTGGGMGLLIFRVCVWWSGLNWGIILRAYPFPVSSCLFPCFSLHV